MGRGIRTGFGQSPYVLIASPGRYAIAGPDAAMGSTGVPVTNYSMPAAAGQYTITGTQPGLSVGTTLTTSTMKWNPGYYLLSGAWNGSGARNNAEINTLPTYPLFSGWVGNYSYGSLFPVQGIAANAATLQALWATTIFADFLQQQKVKPASPFRAYWRTTEYRKVIQNGSTGTSSSNAGGLIPAYIRNAPGGVLTSSKGTVTLPVAANPNEYGWWGSQYDGTTNYSVMIGANLWHQGQNQLMIDDLTFFLNTVVPAIPGLPQYTGFKVKDHPLWDSLKSNDELSYTFGGGGGWLGAPPTAGGYAPTLANGYTCVKQIQAQLRAAAPAMSIAVCGSYGITDGSGNVTTGAMQLDLLNSLLASGNAFSNSDLRINAFAPTWGASNLQNLFVGNTYANMNVNIFTTTLLNPPGGGTDFRGKMEWISQIQGSDYSSGAGSAQWRTQAIVTGIINSSKYARGNSIEFCFIDLGTNDAVQTVNPIGTYVYPAMVAAGGLAAINQNLPLAYMTAPKGLTASGQSPNVLTWTGLPYPNTQYTIYRGTTTNNLVQVGSNITPTTWTDVGPFTQGQTYYYAIAMGNPNGVGPQSAVISSVPNPVPSTYTGYISVTANGKLINSLPGGGGTEIQLRGVNMDGMEYGAVNYPPQSNPWWSPSGPTTLLPLAAQYKFNCVRLILNASCWLGNTCGITDVVKVTWTVAPTIGSTGGTMTTAWTKASGAYPIAFTSTGGPFAYGNFTQNSTAVTWPALTAPFNSYLVPTTSGNVIFWSSTTFNADSFGNYKQYVYDFIAQSQSLGMYVLIDLHWTAPAVTIGGVTAKLLPKTQPAYMDADQGLPFWVDMATRLGSQNGILTGLSTFGPINCSGLLFELMNEPKLDQNGYLLTTLPGGSGANWATLPSPLTVVNPDVAMKTGCYSAACLNYSNPTAPGGADGTFPVWWRVVGCDEVIAAIRATGAKNICLQGGNAWGTSTKNFTKYIPADPTQNPPQIGFTYHPYPNNYAHPYPTYLNPYPYPMGGIPGVGPDTNYAAPTLSDFNIPAAIVQAGYLLICTEIGGQCGPGATSGEPFDQNLANWIDGTLAGTTSIRSHGLWYQWTHPLSYGDTSTSTWAMLSYTSPTNSLASLAPGQGEGVVVTNWSKNHA